MNFKSNRRSARTYVYRIPMDDKTAMRKIRIHDKINDDYFIAKLSKKRDVPNGRAMKNWSYIFYESTEHYDYERDEMVGGTIEGLAEYRYSLDWKPTPESELLEMKRATKGGTRIKGERHIGTHDPRLPDYAPVDTVVPWTLGEIEAMYDGEEVENKTNYSYEDDNGVRRRPDILEGYHGRSAFRILLEEAARDGMEKCEEQLAEYIENCEHMILKEKDRIDSGRFIDVAHCEDCGKSFTKLELEETVDDGQGKVVGTL